TASNGNKRKNDIPASPHNIIRLRKRKLKKLKPRIQMTAVMNTGKNPTIAQLSAMPAPYTSDARNKRHSRSSSRYSSSNQITDANSNNSNISPVQFVACSQNVSCKPQTSAARTGGSQALRMVKNEKSLRSRLRCASVRSCGSNATDRASKPSVKAAHTAENTFSAGGICGAESQRKGYVTRNKIGFATSGCHVQPDILATAMKLDRDTQRFNVNQ